MSMISIEQAAERIGASQETFENWSRQGLIELRTTDSISHALTTNTKKMTLVNEDDLEQVAESLGWLHLSADNWDRPEDE